MIEAALHGKLPVGLQHVEDLITSAVFGLLQYIPPNMFWPVILVQAKSCKDKSFMNKCSEFGIEIGDYEKLDIYFWPIHKQLGEPDLLLIFSGSNQSPLCFIIEAKLGATKSGEGDQDQLNRYLAVLKDLKWINKITGFREPLVFPGLIYLTPSAAWLELYDSINNAQDYLDANSSLFLLQWQDILEISQKVLRDTNEPQRTMLSKIVLFLKHCGLEYFRGFTRLSIDDDISSGVHFYRSAETAFSGFTELKLETLSLTEVDFYTYTQAKTFHGFTIERFEQITPENVVFYGGSE